ncbi:MAG: methyltransferase [Propionibacteriaceae bacterium]|nr:methyltransferase [Propionibacteriaceae bacterium]
MLEQLFRQAGFHDVGTELIPAPLRLTGAADCVRFLRESAGALHQMLSALSAGERDETWQEIHTALSRFERSNGFEGPCELIIGWGTKGDKPRDHPTPAR